MGKGKKKKKHSLKEEVSEDVLDAAALSVRKFRKVTKEIQRLTTGQKIVGGIALLAVGLTYLVKHDFGSDDTADKASKATEKQPSIAPAADTPELAPADAFADEAAALASKPRAPRKARKPFKSKHDS